MDLEKKVYALLCSVLSRKEAGEDVRLKILKATPNEFEAVLISSSESRKIRLTKDTAVILEKAS